MKEYNNNPTSEGLTPSSEVELEHVFRDVGSEDLDQREVHKETLYYHPTEDN